RGDVQIAVPNGAARVDIGNVRQMVVRAAWETDAQAMAHGRAGAVAAGEVGGLARVGRAVGASETGAHSRRRLLECHELRLALNLNAGFSEAIDQEAFGFVLRVDQ